MNTLNALLHDALAQSERFHAHLHAPTVRSTIARKRIVRRGAATSREDSLDHYRTGVACFGGVLIVMCEWIATADAFSLTDEDFLAAATATATMADEARKYAP